MKPPSAAAQKKVTAENLISLGPQRLAEILASVAETRADLKRRLRMELAAQQGVGPLAAEIDKRLGAFETSRGRITWRQSPAFIRDVDALRALIIERLAPLDPSAAIDRFWRYMDAARPMAARYRQRNGELDAVFVHAAADLGGLLANVAPGAAAATLVDSLVKNPGGWKAWLPGLLVEAGAGLAGEALRFMSERRGAVTGWITLTRQLADGAGDVDAFAATWSAEARATPAVASQIASRLLAADRIVDAGEALRAAAPDPASRAKANPDFDWETLWIEYLERSGRPDDAQAVRWASFERTLSRERASAFVSRLGDFDDVEAEQRAFAVAAEHSDAAAGLRFLMEWPALPEAGQMIGRRADDIHIEPEEAELWAGRLRRRFPKAARVLLRSAAAAAFKRRDFRACDRLSAEAEAITP